MKVRFGKSILTKGELLTVRIEQNDQKEINSLSLEIILYGDSNLITNSFEIHKVQTFETEIFVLETKSLPAITYDLVVKNLSTNFEKTHTFSIVDDNTLSEAYKEMIGEEESFIYSQSLQIKLVQNLYDDWEVPFDEEKYINQNESQIGKAFLAEGITDFLNSFLNQGEQIRNPVYLESHTINESTQTNVTKLVWFLSCFSTILRDVANIGNQITLSVNPYRDALEVNLSFSLVSETQFSSVFNNFDRYNGEELASNLIDEVLENPLLEILRSQFEGYLIINKEDFNKISMRISDTEATTGLVMTA